MAAATAKKFRSKITKLENVDVKAITVTKPKDLASKNVFGFLNHKGSNLRIQSPLVNVVFTPKVEPKKVGKPGEMECKLAISLEGDDEGTTLMRNFFMGIDHEMTHDLAHKHREDWFPGKSEDRIPTFADAMYRVLTYRAPKKNASGSNTGETHPPKVTFTVDMDENFTPKVQVIYKDDETIPCTIADIARNSKVYLIFEMTSVWNVGGRYGINPRVTHIALTTAPNHDDSSATGFDFTSDSTSVSSPLATKAVYSALPAPSGTGYQSPDEDEDESASEHEEERGNRDVALDKKRKDSGPGEKPSLKRSKKIQ